MQQRCLGNTDLKVSTIGLGGWALGGGPDWGTTNERDVQDTVLAALDAGINLIDTAPIYGNSEELLGHTLKGHRSQVVLTTKCGLTKNDSWTDHDLRPATIISQLEQSLQKLQTDYIDLYFIHYLDPKVPWQDALDTLALLQKQGKIRHIGVCNVPADILEVMIGTGLVSCVQDECSLLHADKSRRVRELCLEHGLGFMAYGSLCGGILSGKYKREPNLRRADARRYFYKCYYGGAFAAVQPAVQKVKELALEKQVPSSSVALAWVLLQSGVSCALAGARTRQQVLENMSAANVLLSKTEQEFLYASDH
ncbi:MAG: aldo/keto reductase [Elusimicrobiaceae bacterium]|nr:aldo/keto reductase [Elusimicrobiaceae bacterium]